MEHEYKLHNQVCASKQCSHNIIIIIMIYSCLSKHINYNVHCETEMNEGEEKTA